MSLPSLLGVGHVLLAPFPDDQILMAFPVEGVWSVGQGGPSVLTNTHVPYANQRYALDLVKVGPDGKFSRQMADSCKITFHGVKRYVHRCRGQSSRRSSLIPTTSLGESMTATRGATMC